MGLVDLDRRQMGTAGTEGIDMTDKRKIEILRTALQVIHTWATFNQGRQCLTPEHVEKLCSKALQETETKKEKQ